jgi:hypothetical protein
MTQSRFQAHQAEARPWRGVVRSRRLNPGRPGLRLAKQATGSRTFEEVQG